MLSYVLPLCLYVRAFYDSIRAVTLYFTLLFIGSSFITDNTGRVVERADRSTPGVIVSEIDVGSNTYTRAAWGVFRDRRPDLYGAILTKDGSTSAPR